MDHGGATPADSAGEAGHDLRLDARDAAAELATPPDLLLSPDQSLCGNGKLESGEACDKGIAAGKLGACPAGCDDQDPCTNDSLTGSAADCSARCTHQPQSPCCGNGKLESGETCDKGIAAGKAGACPTSCDDQDPCTSDSLGGNAASCDAKCLHAPQACCGNGVKEGAEQCDDGNKVDSDTCRNTCKLPGGHLLITEAATSPTAAEFVEIFNPTAAPLPLGQVYLADHIGYHHVTTGTVAPYSSDFVARFPAGSVLAPGAHAVVAVAGASAFFQVHGKKPDYELLPGDPAVPDMVAPAAKAIGSTASLTNTGELLVLFSWNGSSDLVTDLDYVIWGSGTIGVDKSGQCIDGVDPGTTTSCYQADTSSVNQRKLVAPGANGSIHRCNHLETGEKHSGGNGAAGHDETSEPLSGAGATWKTNLTAASLRTPGAGPAKGYCP